MYCTVYMTHFTTKVDFQSTCKPIFYILQNKDGFKFFFLYLWKYIVVGTDGRRRDETAAIDTMARDI